MGVVSVTELWQNTSHNICIQAGQEHECHLLRDYIVLCVDMDGRCQETHMAIGSCRNDALSCEEGAFGSSTSNPVASTSIACFARPALKLSKVTVNAYCFPRLLEG